MPDSQQKLCLIKYEWDIYVYNYKKTDNLWFLYLSDLRISTAEKCIAIINI